MRHLFVLLLLGIGLSGCITPTMLPQVSLDSFAVVSNPWPQRETYIATLRIHNDNDKPMRTDGLQMALVLDGDRPVSGVSNTPITIPPFGDALVQVSVDRKPVPRDGKGPVPYKIDGSVRLKGAGLMPFYDQGELSR